jgi:hypothetical protein
LVASFDCLCAIWYCDGFSWLKFKWLEEIASKKIEGPLVVRPARAVGGAGFPNLAPLGSSAIGPPVFVTSRSFNRSVAWGSFASVLREGERRVRLSAKQSFNDFASQPILRGPDICLYQTLPTNSLRPKGSFR